MKKKFKKGMKVEVINLVGFKADDGYCYLKNYAKIGDIFKVTTSEYNYSGEIGININDDYNYCYPIECFKLVTEEVELSNVINNFQLF